MNEEKCLVRVFYVYKIDAQTNVFESIDLAITDGKCEMDSTLLRKVEHSILSMLREKRGRVENFVIHSWSFYTKQSEA